MLVGTDVSVRMIFVWEGTGVLISRVVYMYSTIKPINKMNQIVINIHRFFYRNYITPC